MSLAGKTNLIKMILMPQLLYLLHNTPVVIPIKIFRVVNSLFRLLFWHKKPPGSNWNNYKIQMRGVVWHSPTLGYTIWLHSCNT